MQYTEQCDHATGNIKTLFKTKLYKTVVKFTKTETDKNYSKNHFPSRLAVKIPFLAQGSHGWRSG